MEYVVVVVVETIVHLLCVSNLAPGVFLRCGERSVV